MSLVVFGEGTIVPTPIAAARAAAAMWRESDGSSEAEDFRFGSGFAADEAATKRVAVKACTFRLE